MNVSPTAIRGVDAEIQRLKAENERLQGEIDNTKFTLELERSVTRVAREEANINRASAETAWKMQQKQEAQVEILLTIIRDAAVTAEHYAPHKVVSPVIQSSREGEIDRLLKALTRIAQLASTQYHPLPLEDRLRLIYELAAATDKE